MAPLRRPELPYNAVCICERKVITFLVQCIMRTGFEDSHDLSFINQVVRLTILFLKLDNAREDPF